MFGIRWRQARACIDAMTPSMDWEMLLALTPPPDSGIRQPRFAAMCRHLQLYYTEVLDEYPHEHTLRILYGFPEEPIETETPRPAKKLRGRAKRRAGLRRTPAGADDTGSH